MKSSTKELEQLYLRKKSIEKITQIDSMVELGFHLGCEKLKGRRTMMIADGLKDYSSTADIAREPRILVGDDCTFKRQRRWLLLPPPWTPPES